MAMLLTFAFALALGLKSVFALVLDPFKYSGSVLPPFLGTDSPQEPKKLLITTAGE